MGLLTSADYPAIRAALDAHLDTTLLPDATIELSPFLGAAELEVADRDPNAATRTGDDLARVKLAVIYLAAANLAPSVPRLISSSAGDSSFTLTTINWDELARTLKGKADAQLRAVLTPTPSAHFGRAEGRRGRWA